MRLTYHGTLAAHFDSLDPREPYVPQGFERDGFIHCTDGARSLADVLSEFYGESEGDWLALYIDSELVEAPVKYEDPERVLSLSVPPTAVRLRACSSASVLC